jgi:hypothetical protein
MYILIMTLITFRTLTILTHNQFIYPCQIVKTLMLLNISTLRKKAEEVDGSCPLLLGTIRIALCPYQRASLPFPSHLSFTLAHRLLPVACIRIKREKTMMKTEAAPVAPGTVTHALEEMR